MNHIEQAIDAEAAQKASERSVSETAAGGDQKVKEEARVAAQRPGPILGFYIDHTAPDGQRFHGAFKNQRLTIAQRIQVGTLKARYAGDIPVGNLDDYTQSTIEMIAHLQVSLVEKPAWAADLLSLDDVDLVEKIYAEVVKHERTFRRGT